MIHKFAEPCSDSSGAFSVSFSSSPPFFSLLASGLKVQPANSDSENKEVGVVL